MIRKKKKRKLVLFRRKVRVDNVRPNYRSVKVGRKRLSVFKCGKEIVVYKGEEVVFNSVIDEISYADWLKELKG